MLPSVIKTAPAVCAVRREYQILVPTAAPVLLWVRVGDKAYFDDSNGILRSETELHRVRVPMAALDAAGAYTVCYREVIERKPYYSDTGEVQSVTFAFRPVAGDRIRAYMIADAHGMLDPVVCAVKKFEEVYGKIDFLILNGDILDHSGRTEKFALYYEIAAAVTGGEIPVVISRGNHDLRGKCAEKLADYMPNDGGRSYYSFRLGSLWGLLLDCGEDKLDDQIEYGNTICCRAFRERETDFLRQIIENAANEYAAEGVRHRIVLSHIPFTQSFEPPFNIEQDTYGEWTRLLGAHVRPEALLSGHKHQLYITEPGGTRDAYGMTFPTVVGSEVRPAEKYFAGCGLLLDENGLHVVFNDGDGVKEEIALPPTARPRA